MRSRLSGRRGGRPCSRRVVADAEDGDDAAPPFPLPTGPASPDDKDVVVVVVVMRSGNVAAVCSPVIKWMTRTKTVPFGVLSTC